MVFRLLKRADAALSHPGFESGWAGRLHGIGRALDEHETVLRDLAITTAGYDIWISAFEYRAGMYRSLWAPVTFRVEDHAAEYIASGEERAPKPRPAGWYALAPPEPWIKRLRALGHLLDRSDPVPRDVVILDIEGGFVVQKLIPSPAGTGEWITSTGEVEASQIAAATKSLPAVPKIRYMRLRTLELA